MSYVLTIDIGTTSAKALVVSHQGQVIATSQAFYQTYFPQPGYSEQKPLEILDGIKSMIRKLKTQHDKKIEAIGLSSAMHSLMAIDEKGTPLSPLILWSDMRSTDIARQLKDTPVGKELYHNTGTAVHPMAPLSKLIWIRDNDHGLFTSAYKFISIKEFVLYHLCGTLAVDYSVASSTGMFDIHQLKWSDLALSTIGIDAGKLSSCVSPHHCTSRLRSEVATDLGINPDAPIVMGASDGCLAHYGSHAMGKGQLSLTIGTSGAVRVASKEYLPDPQCRIFNYRLDEEYFIAGGATNNGTVLFNWFCNSFGDGEKPDVKVIVERAAIVTPSAEGLLFLPYVFGERAPYYNPDLRGAYIGLAQHHTKAHLSRALLEGICLEIRSIVNSVEESAGAVNEIFASGGFVRSSFWLQLMADVLGKSLTLRDVNDASSLGAALMAFQCIGVEPQFEKPTKGQVFNPNRSCGDLYTELHAVFTSATVNLMPELQRLGGLIIKG